MQQTTHHTASVSSHVFLTAESTLDCCATPCHLASRCRFVSYPNIPPIILFVALPLSPSFSLSLSQLPRVGEAERGVRTEGDVGAPGGRQGIPCQIWFRFPPSVCIVFLSVVVCVWVLPPVARRWPVVFFCIAPFRCRSAGESAKVSESRTRRPPPPARIVSYRLVPVVFYFVNRATSFVPLYRSLLDAWCCNSTLDAGGSSHRTALRAW